MPRPDMNTTWRSKMSAIRPPKRKKPPNVSAKALTTHCRSAGASANSGWIEGRATFHNRKVQHAHERRNSENHQDCCRSHPTFHLTCLLPLNSSIPAHTRNTMTSRMAVAKPKKPSALLTPSTLAIAATPATRPIAPRATGS